MELRKELDIKKLPYWSVQYSYPLSDEGIESLIPKVQKRGFLLKDEFITICKWKTPRTTNLCKLNTEKDIEDFSRIAFSTKNEKLRIGVLTLLKGVDYPTASVFLHFFHNEKYPIIDYRALWSLGEEKAPNRYEYSFWEQYVKICRELSMKSKLDMRTIDRALWAYSQKNQPKKK